MVSPERRRPRMKRLLLFGAGQLGAAMSRLAGTGLELLGFADNDESKWGTFFMSLPVLPPEEALRLRPELVCLCAAGGERREQMEAQLRGLGYTGELISPELLELFDPRVGTLRLLAEQIEALDIPGDAAELGVFRGDFARLINAAFPRRIIHLFDSFEGFPARDADLDRLLGYSRAAAGDFGGVSPALVEAALPHRELARFHRGLFPESFAGCEGLRFAFVSIDADLYAPTAAALPLFWDRLSPGGVLMVHDATSRQYAGVGRALGEFCAQRSLLPTPVCDLHGSALLRKGLR